MKKLTFLLLVVSSFFCFSQNEKEEIHYLLFDTSSNETYSYEVGDGKIGIEKIYTKAVKKNGVITFYIEKEMFLSNKKQVDTCTIDYLKKIKISNIKDLKEDVKKINPLYPYKVFPNLYLIEKINDSIIIKHKVRWEYYIE